MRDKAFVFGVILLMQVCGTLWAEPATPEPEAYSAGLLQSLMDRAREANAKVQQAKAVALGFVGAYYEDHIQPVKDSYAEWASDITNSMWESVWGTGPTNATMAP
nr:apolipoprotein C-IV [Solea senegalensis]